MCLAIITQTENLPEEVVAWKVFRIIPGSSNGKGKPWDYLFKAEKAVVTSNRGNQYLLTTWVTAEELDHQLLVDSIWIPDPTRRSYVSGFHAFQNRWDARRSTWARPTGVKVLKVRLRKLVCAGEGDGTDEGNHIPQWVAREMFVEDHDPGENEK